ncbi:MAG: hypothetical protein K0S07_52, partial [Chlamydiales bacterium]|nr:hypothetical protein [Chlamydiales bacterium]
LAANLKELSLFKQMASHLTFPRHKIAFEQFLIRFLASSYGIPQKKEEVLSYLEQGFFKYGDISLAKVFFHLLKGDAPESLFAHFFQEIDVTWKNEKEQTALDLAARYGRGEIALRLLEMGALANTDRDNRSSLFQAVIGNQAALILPLLEKGAAIDQMGHSPDYPGQETALHLAARRRFFPCLKALLSAEARRDLSGIEGRTPFLEAVISGHLPSIELLSRGFPSSQMQDIAGNNALHLALLHSGKFRWAETKELLSFLRHLNVDARACNLTGQSPLQLASSLNAPIEVLNILKIKK